MLLLNVITTSINFWTSYDLKLTDLNNLKLTSQEKKRVKMKQSP